MKLNRVDEAAAVFRKLIDYGQAHLNDEMSVDYFAVSLPDFLVFEQDLKERNRIHCHYMMGLGFLGLGDLPAAKEHFDAVLAMDLQHLGVILHRKMV